MSVKTEVKSLRRICMQGVTLGTDTNEISPLIYFFTDYRTNTRMVILDIYSRNRALADDNSQWEIDRNEEQRIVLPVHNRGEFRRAYGLARLLRGRPRSREALLHWRTYG
ncbi:hypothetical protein GEM17_18240 [Salmonella enterica]|nr:hypothetical protein [Salmonella enterica]EHQ1784657.1 hypothetical protein [Salmonella enterica subsp. enterica serovar Oranienburg]